MIIYTYAKKGQLVPDWNVPEKYKLVVFCTEEVEVPKSWYKSTVKPIVDDEEVVKNIHKILPHRKMRDATYFVDLDKKIKQSIDLAKLSQNNLTGKDLTEFINRSIDLIK